MKSKNSTAACGCGARRATPTPWTRAIAGAIDEPVDRRAVVLELLGLVIVDGQRERHFARHHQIDEQGVALAHRHAVGRDDVAEQLESLGLAEVADDAGKPVDILGLDAELAFPLRVQQVVIRFRHVLFFDQLGVVSAGENVEPGADPFAVRQYRLRQQVGEVGRFHFDQQFFPVQRFHLRPVGLEDVGVEAAAVRLGGRALHDVFRARAPHPDFHAVFFLERRRHDTHVVDRRGVVDGEHAFFFGAFDQPPRAVRALISRDFRGGRRRALRLRECRCACGEREQPGDCGQRESRMPGGQFIDHRGMHHAAFGGSSDNSAS